MVTGDATPGPDWDGHLLLLHAAKARAHAAELLRRYQQRNAT